MLRHYKNNFDHLLITDTLGRVHETTIINEPGIYALIFSSKFPQARAFKHWVTQRAERSFTPWRSPADNAIRNHAVDENRLMHQISASGQKRNMTIINESGVYALIFSSKLPQAKVAPVKKRD